MKDDWSTRALRTTWSPRAARATPATARPSGATRPCCAGTGRRWPDEARPGHRAAPLGGARDRSEPDGDRRGDVVLRRRGRVLVGLDPVGYVAAALSGPAVALGPGRGRLAVPPGAP